MTLEVSFRNQLWSALSLISLWCILIALAAWLNFEEHMVGVLAVGLAGATIPTLYLHIQYYLSDKGKKVIISRDFVDVVEKGSTKRHSARDISIEIYMSASVNFPITPVEPYHFARLRFVDGAELIITSLMIKQVTELLKVLSPAEVKRKKIAFCSLNLRWVPE